MKKEKELGFFEILGGMLLYGILFLAIIFILNTFFPIFKQPVL